MRAEVVRPPPGIARVSLGEVRRHPVELGVCVGVLGLVLVGIATARHTAPSAVESVVKRVPLAEPAPLLTGAAATRFCLLLLNQAREKLDDVHSMRAVLHTRDRIDGVLADLAVIALQVRRDPLSVHIRWRSPESGRELVWVENANEAATVSARQGGHTASAIVPLDPANESVRQFTPRPIAELALWALNGRLLDYVKGLDEAAGCQMIDGVQIDGRPCWMFRFVEHYSGTTRKHEVARVCIDRSLELPVAAEFHDGARHPRRESTLVESWAVTNLELNPELGDSDFRLRDAEDVAGQKATVAHP
ncbi:MAG: DUF1571 domain-containing protein [Planctomycetia bacterium]|nr:DUF1571 domain-containing protein [Planctomycetia bacterium]